MHGTYAEHSTMKNYIACVCNHMWTIVASVHVTLHFGVRLTGPLITKELARTGIMVSAS